MKTALVGATIIDGNGGPPMPDSTIVIENERISAFKNTGERPRTCRRHPLFSSNGDGVRWKC